MLVSRCRYEDICSDVLDDKLDALQRCVKIERAEGSTGIEGGKEGNVEIRRLGHEQRNDNVLAGRTIGLDLKIARES